MKTSKKLIIKGDTFIYLGYFYGHVKNNIMTIFSECYVYEQKITRVNEYPQNDGVLATVKIEGQIWEMLILVRKTAGIRKLMTVPPDLHFDNVADAKKFIHFLREIVK